MSLISRSFFLLVALILAFGSAAPLRAAGVMVFAAASLTDSLKEIGAAFQSATGTQVQFNFGASSTLARQIEQGAPADIFFSADEAKMDGLEKKGLLEPGTRQSRLGNHLVVVVPRDHLQTIATARDLTNSTFEKIALADPVSVPAGIYARQWLEKAGCWDQLKSKVIPTQNVRAALAAVASGNVDAGVVYQTDAGISPEVKIAYTVPVQDAPQISYPMALVKDASSPGPARRFLQYLASPAAAKVFQKFGFVLRN